MPLSVVVLIVANRQHSTELHAMINCELYNAQLGLHLFGGTPGPLKHIFVGGEVICWRQHITSPRTKMCKLIVDLGVQQ